MYRHSAVTNLLFQLDSLEFAWNMPRFTLNVDTRANVIRRTFFPNLKCIFLTLTLALVSSKFHRLFDLNHWLLVPEASIINAYYDARNKRRNFPIIEVRTTLLPIHCLTNRLQQRPSYKYTVVAHPNMLHVPIHRQNSLPTDENEPPVDYTFYPHPYHNFPVIVSHVHPRFVICNTGAKLLGPTDWPVDLLNLDMLKIQGIWKAWSQLVDRSKPDGQAFVNNPYNGDPDFGDNDSLRTSSHRQELRKRKGPEQQGSPTPASKSSKKQRPADDGTWLDDDTLHEFDQQTSTHAGGMRSKKQLILDWLNGVSTTEVKESVKGNKNVLDVIMAFPGAFLEDF